ncbi:MAG: MoxR family ATPase [Dehalococcoidia bacterium]
MEEEIQRLGQIVFQLQNNIERVIVGKREVAELALVAVLCEGHILIEDVPGIGKTLLARSIARSLGCSFRRIQCTPDLLPSDMTGTHIFNQRSNAFEFRAGPVFSQVLLADEVNRATPRTQSALLEAMEERQVTVDGETMALPRPFLVLATQNPIELEGTFPLPEAQLDRFLLRLRMGYPSKDADHAILARFRETNPIDELQPVVGADDLTGLLQVCRRVLIDPDVEQYIVDLVHATREHPEVELGASPRAMLALYHTSQALAAMRGRSFVVPDDVKYLTPFVFEHRIIPKAQSHLRGSSAAEIVAEAVQSVPVPAEQVSERR